MSKERGPYSSPRQQQRRRRILRIAGLQLERHGLAALTMKSIAEASDVSTKTLYNLFDSRDSLLLEAATERLENFAESASVMDTEAGIPRLLAYTEGTMRGIDHTPEFARAVISLVFRAELDHSIEHSRLRRVQGVAFTSLCVAAEQRELRPGLHLLDLSYLIAANQWGIALLWERGLLTLEQMEAQAILSHYLTLTPLCRGKRKKLMEAKLAELLTRPLLEGPDILEQSQDELPLGTQTISDNARS